MVNCGMFTKWKINIKGLENYRFTDNGDLYRLPYKSNKNSYGLRKIKMQYPNRWRMNGAWWSKDQLRLKLIEDNNPIEILRENEYPF